MTAARAVELVRICAERGVMCTTAESCTGGLVAGTITDIPGSSSALDRGFVTYSNEAKTEMLGVEADLIARHGAVSAEVASAMAAGAIAHSRADIAVAITGIAGPDGGTDDKPVGLVHFAAMRRGEAPVLLERRYGETTRAAIRMVAVEDALDLLLQLIRR